MTFEQGDCLGIPGITAHRAVHRQAGARVIATCRSESDMEAALRAGAHEVMLAGEGLAERIRGLAPDGVDHVVEVAFGTNIKVDIEALAQGGSIATLPSNSYRLSEW